ncbi:MAG: hypothetical protein ABS76_26645 [Pelagibacterium sp. SCN 64-44]|nr:MAG: hypothetical protein ABS76_26645 [Pelagibacterium sp. SCN 64-44]
MSSTIHNSGGADPGLHGAIARIAYDTVARRGLLRVHRMPTVLVGKSNPRPQPDPIGIAALLRELGLDHLVLEKVNGMIGEGASRAFAFGHGRGAVAGAAAALGIPLSEPVPTVWKPKLAVPSDKKLAKARATQLLPGCAAAWPLAGDHDLAEAALLAFYGLLERGIVPINISLEA